MGLELKSGNDVLSAEQVEVNSILKDLVEIHVIRAIQLGQEWTFWDDTERWVAAPVQR